MGRTVIVGYRPKVGMEDALMSVVVRHWPALRAQALVSERPAQLMRAADGTIVEVFEWLCTQSIERAHGDATIQALWAEFAAVGDCIPIGELAEAGRLFSQFESLPAPGPG